MSGERRISKNQEYGTLSARPYVIFGNDIVAFYDKSDDLVFVLDNTVNAHKPNVLLVINPDGDKKWDEILSGDYLVDLENIRPKQDNKYQKLDIEYSGLAVYENLINAYNSGEDLTDYLSQLDVLRDSAARHSAIIRLNAANEIIAKANNTIVKTKETISELQSRLKTLRAKLSGYRKEIGKISTKQSASKILRVESQIEATNEKLKRAKNRLESAQRRLAVATTDAELSSALLNTPVSETKHVEPKHKSVMVAPKYPVQTTAPEEDETEEAAESTEDSDTPEQDFDEPESDIKPLFDKDPEILNEDIAFKPISFDFPTMPMDDKDDKSENQIVENIPDVSELPEPKENIFESVDVPDFNALTVKSDTPESEESDSLPVLNTDALLSTKPEINTADTEEPELPELPEPIPELKSVLNSMTPVPQFEPEIDEDISIEKPQDIKPVEDLMRPVPPMYNHLDEQQKTENIPEKPIVVEQITETFNAPVSGVNENAKSKFLYYILLIFLIVLSVLTLWLYQNNMNNTTPVLTPKTSESGIQQKQTDDVVKTEEPVVNDVIEETVFLDDEPEIQSDADVITESVVVPEEPGSPEISEPTESIIQEPEEQPEPEIIPEDSESELYEDLSEPDSIQNFDAEPDFVPEDTDEIQKPEYDAGSKHEDMFVIDSESAVDEPEFMDDMFNDDEE